MILNFISWHPLVQGLFVIALAALFLIPFVVLEIRKASRDKADREERRLQLSFERDVERDRLRAIHEGKLIEQKPKKG